MGKVSHQHGHIPTNQRCQFPAQEKKGLEELNAFTGMVFKTGLEPNILKLDGVVKHWDASA